MAGLPYDPTIPRGGTRIPPKHRSSSMLTGWFTETKTGEVVLVAKTGARWPVELVSITQGFWGSGDNTEGVSKLPRIRRYDDNGNIVQSGDMVLIQFAVKGDRKFPVVTGGVRGLTRSDFLPYSLASEPGNPNRLAMRLVPRDHDDVASGYIDIEIAGDDRASLAARFHAANQPAKDQPPNKRVSIEIDPGEITGGQVTNAKVEASLPSGEVVGVRDGGISLEAPAGSRVNLGSSSPSNAYILSTSFLADLKNVLTEISAMGVAIPVPTPFTDAMLVKLGLSAYDSTKVFGE